MGTGYKLNPSELNNHNKMCYTKVPPLLTSLPRPPPVRPMTTTIMGKPVRRNLFGSCKEGETDRMLATQQEKDIDYVMKRYNIDLRKIQQNCHPEISTYTDKNKTHLAANSSPYARIPGVKGYCRVRKAHNANSNVPKRITNNLSSELGTTGQQQQQQQQQQHSEERLQHGDENERQ